MDITESNFWQTLPTVVEAMAGALFVAMDLEMTGVRLKKPRKLISSPTLGDAYREAKEGAECFQILQIGLTCAQYDRSKKAYVLKTFNFQLTPMFTGGSHAGNMMARILDRKISLSYATLLFLQSHRFCMENAFEKGIPYLSRKESLDAYTEFLEKDKIQANKYRVELSHHGPEVGDFYRKMRQIIRSWVDGPQEDDFVNISNPHGDRFTNFQVRLVHQIVNTDFPGYRAYARLGQSFMQVVKADEKEEEEFWKSRLEERKRAVVVQTGFRYVVEALLGGSFATEVSSVLASIYGSNPDKTRSLDDTKTALRLSEAKLRANPPILVGHNQMADLCFLYQTFIGQLPDTLQAFQQEIHKLFPRIIDTKYMNARGRHILLADDSLEESFAAVQEQTSPKIEYHPLYRYVKQAVHEAGYDSMMTAVVLIRLSYKLVGDEGQSRHISDEDDSNGHKNRDGDVQVRNEAPRLQAPPPTSLSRFATQNPYSALSTSGSPSPSPAQLHSAVWPMGYEKRSGSTGSLLDDDDEDQLSDQYMEPLKPVPAKPPVLKHTEASSEPGNAEGEDPEQIPPWQAEFWRKYGNKVPVAQAGVVVFDTTPTSA